MRLFILLFGILQGCASRTKIGFYPANSMCMDSLFANMNYSGCKSVMVEKDMYGISKIYCENTHSENKSNSSWRRKEFYAIAFGTAMPNDVKPICTDPFIILTSKEK